MATRRHPSSYRGKPEGWGRRLFDPNIDMSGRPVPENRRHDLGWAVPAGGFGGFSRLGSQALSRGGSLLGRAESALRGAGIGAREIGTAAGALGTAGAGTAHLKQQGGTQKRPYSGSTSLIDQMLEMAREGRYGGEAEPTPIGSVGIGPDAIARGTLGGDRQGQGSQGLDAVARRALKGGDTSGGEEQQGPPPTQPNYGLPEGQDPGRGIPGVPGGGGGAGGGMGGIADMLRQMQEQQAARQEAMRRQLGSSYDRQIEAVRGQGPIMRGLAEEAQGNIGGFFDYAAEAAEGGRAPIQSAYDTASGNVDAAYGQATEQVQGLPSVYTELAAEAGGEGARSGVASRVAAAAAPFEASLASGQAAVQGNLSQSQAAGEQYLSQLASAAPSEAAMAQSGVEGALQQQLQDIQMQAAQLEGAKQRALMQAASDTSGDVFDRMMDLQQLQMDRERHNMALKQGEMGLKQSELEMQQQAQGGNPMAGMDMRERLQTEKLMGELNDPTLQQPKRGFDMFLQQQFGDQPELYQSAQRLGNRLTSSWPMDEMGEPVPAEDAVDQIMNQLGVVQGAEDLGLGDFTPIDRESSLKVRRALEILAGLYQE